MLLGGIGEALATFLVMMAITAKSAHAPGPVLLTGAAIDTFAATLITVVLASGDPRAVYVLAWSMGADLPRHGNHRVGGIGDLAGRSCSASAFSTLAANPATRRPGGARTGASPTTVPNVAPVAVSRPHRRGNLDRRPLELCRTDRSSYSGDDHASETAEPGLVRRSDRGSLDDRS